MNLSNSALTYAIFGENDIGCPRNGLVNDERLRCKYKYKQAIKDAAFNAEQSLNDELFNHLCTKDNLSFWKEWRKRFCVNNVAPTTVFDFVPYLFSLWSVMLPNSTNDASMH